MAMRIPIRQMNGKVTILEVMPESTVRQLKRQLKGWQVCEEELTRKMSKVDLIVGEKQLVDGDETVIQAGISPEATVHVLFSITPVECSSKAAAGCDLDSLIVVDIPEVQRIETAAFSNCSSLVKVTFHDSVREIGDGSFKGCSSLEILSLPSQLTAIRREAFQGCSSLPHVTIPDCVIVIWPHAFDCCSSLLSVTLGQSVELIEPGAFSSCSSLKHLTITNTLCYIGKRAFANCTSLQSVTMGDWKRMEFPEGHASLYSCEACL